MSLTATVHYYHIILKAILN